MTKLDRTDGICIKDTCRYRQYNDASSHESYRITLHEPAHNHLDVPESVVQDIWATQQFQTSALKTVQNATLLVLDPGKLNSDQGPDFLGARIQIDGTIWAGHIEIHTHSGCWVDHRHDQDAHYNSVILHVVLQQDIWTGGITRQDGTSVAELVLYPYLQKPLRSLMYSFFTRRDTDILCTSGWDAIDRSVVFPYVRTLARERLISKYGKYCDRSPETPRAFEKQLHMLVFRALGYAQNAEAMTLLAHRIPTDLAHEITCGQDLEALYLGVSGLLPFPSELLDFDRNSADYVMDLRDRYERLQIEYQIPEMKKEMWSLFRLRPANFPHLRIAQAAGLFAPFRLFHTGALKALMTLHLQVKPLRVLRALLDVSLSPFWNTHYRIDKRTKPRSSCIGRQRVDTIICDAILPVLLHYAEANNDQVSQSGFLDMLKSIPAKEDDVVRKFIEIGLKPRNACDVQGLHQLYRTRCQKIRCLSCDIGKYIFNNNNTL